MYLGWMRQKDTGIRNKPTFYKNQRNHHQWHAFFAVLQ